MALSLDSSLARLRGALPRSLFWRLYWFGIWCQESIKSGYPVLKIRNSERAVLTEALVGEAPFQTAIEVGCGFGQNFYTLCSLLPKVSFTGVDLDSERIAAAKELSKRAGLHNVNFEVTDARSLKKYQDSSFDIVYTCASLLLVPPQDLSAVLRELLRVAKKRVLLLEQHLATEKRAQVLQSPEGSPLESELNYKYWVHDYVRELQDIVPAERIRVTKVPAPRWAIESWSKSATLIEVSCA